MGKRRPRPKLRIGKHYFEVNGDLVEIDPLKTDLPSRVRLIWAEAMTGHKYRFVPKEKPESQCE